jgi:hypothetical protein
MPRKRYQWPASKIDAGLMHRAHIRQQQTGQRITQMMREALAAYLADGQPGPKELSSDQVNQNG